LINFSKKFYHFRECVESFQNRLSDLVVGLGDGFMGLIWDENIDGYPEKFKDESAIESVDIFAKKKTTTTSSTISTSTSTSTTTSTMKQTPSTTSRDEATTTSTTVTVISITPSKSSVVNVKKHSKTLLSEL